MAREWCCDVDDDWFCFRFAWQVNGVVMLMMTGLF